ncbi:MAG: DsbE family thiol:disulfide interchange protein [Thiothrix sp.]|uniref:DsbE family thiol:disulfide interchange protein n=1 Tax=Thiothrix sp. TaxID=1032 RepID=UPI002632C1F6|nr:DsbE family thiol:disulfide interchange protein [Thiothrix sp.]MDD5395056.1 DsbE family thiol:disulfide interchange protein [Thiothrix sp.]
MSRYFIPLAGFLLLLVLLAVGLNLNPREVPSPFIGKPAPSFTLPSLYGEASISPANLKGEVWLLNVWASWCATCQQEHVMLEYLIKRADIKAIGLNYKDQAGDAKRWLERLGNPFQSVVMDTDGKAGIEWGVYGTPETFIIDAQGVVRHKHIGALTEPVVQRELLPLIQQLRKEATP